MNDRIQNASRITWRVQSSRLPLHFVRSSSVQPFLSFCDRAGLATERFCSQAHMPLREALRPDGLLPLHSCYRFLDTVIRREGLLEFGALVARGSSPFALGPLGDALIRTQTVADYLHTGARVIASHSNTGMRIILSREGDNLRVVFAAADGPGLGPATVELHALVMTLQTLHQALGPRFEPGEISLGASAESLLRDLELPVRAPLAGGREVTSFTVPRRLLSQPLAGRPERSALPARGNPRPLPGDYAASIDLVLETLLEEGIANVDSVAAACGTSSRALQRRLRENGTTFRERLSRCRIVKARRGLAADDRPIAEIALELGYTDASNFSRAFFRATGQSPREYRDGLAPPGRMLRRDEA